MIEGHKNLKECAYVGDNSSEENDDDISSEENHNVSVTSQMTKIVPGVVLNVSLAAMKVRNEDFQKTANESNRKRLRTDEKTQNVHLQFAEEMYLKERREKAYGQETSKVVEAIKAPPVTDSAEVLEDVLTKLKSLGPRGKQILQKLKNQTDDGTDTGSSEDILNVLDELIKDVYNRNGTSKNSKKVKVNETRADVEKEEFQKLHNKIMVHRSRVGLVDREPNTGQEVEFLFFLHRQYGYIRIRK